MRSSLSLGKYLLIIGAAFPFIARADTAPSTAPSGASGNAAAHAQGIADKAFDFLKKQQKPDFSWQNSYDPPGITAIVLRAFMADEKFDADQPFLDKAFDKLLSFQKDNGGIYQDALANYNTAIAVSALAVSKEEEYKKPIAKALEYLRSLQFSDKIEGVQPDVHVDSDTSPKFGGFGYGKKGRPDLSNTQFALDALHDAGVKPGDPAFAAAMKFATRCQNLSETNDQKFAGDDGGFIYTDDGTEGSNPAGEYKGPDGRTFFRSYGSMTYAGLKSMIYAGLSKDDPRVKAAWAWITKNYTVDENPGMVFAGADAAKGGLYYYYMTMARALRAYGQPVITDADGKKHDWRIDLINKLATLQRPDGSFVGEKRWMEDNSVLVTSYALLALEDAKADLKENPTK